MIAENKCAACAADTPMEGARVCPACGHVFKGNGWDGIDAHWRAKHERTQSYEAFFGSLCAAHRGSSHTFHIRDPLEDAHLRAIEVDVSIGRDRRWCFFVTPNALASCGDWVEGTEVRVHPGVPHMIVVTQLDEQIIKSVLASLDERGELRAHTAPIESV